jgi:hypothetical protein
VNRPIHQIAPRRHRKFVVGAAIAALAAITSQATAHVTVGIPTLGVTTLEYRTPVEPAPTTPEELAAHHTDKLVVSLPAGFKVEGCTETANFSCSFTLDQVTFVRRPGSTSFASVDFFEVSARTPGIAGTYRTPALQVYNDGLEVNWADADAADPHPAPQIRVNGPDRAPAVAVGVFRPLSELGAGNPCPQSVIDDAIRLGIDPALHCSHFGFEPPAGSPPVPHEPGEDEVDVRGTATVIRTATSTFVEVTVRGLEPGVVYDAHLHEGTCADPTSAHYKNDPAGPSEPPNELWPSSDANDPTAGLTAGEDGVARGFGVAEWVARPTARAIWIHEPPADPNDPHAHARIGCANLA